MDKSAAIFLSALPRLIGTGAQSRISSKVVQDFPLPAASSFRSRRQTFSFDERLSFSSRLWKHVAPFKAATRQVQLFALTRQGNQSGFQPTSRKLCAS